MKFMSEDGEVVGHETPIGSIIGKKLRVRQVENAATFCFTDFRYKKFRYEFKTFPSFTNCLPSLKMTHKLEDDWTFRLSFDGHDVSPHDNLAILESSNESGILVTRVEAIEYEALGHRGQLFVQLNSTIQDCLMEWRRAATGVEMRSADRPNKTLTQTTKLSVFFGKLLLVFYDGQPWHFEVLVGGGQRIKPDIKEMRTVGESKGAFLTRYRRELKLADQIPSSFVFCSRDAVFADEAPITAIDKEACFVCIEALYDCRVQLPGRLWDGKFIGTATCWQVRQELLGSGAVTQKSFALTLNNERVGDDVLLAPLLFRATRLMFGIESTEATLLVSVNRAVFHVLYDSGQVRMIKDLGELLAHRFVFPTQTYNISIPGNPPLDPGQLLTGLTDLSSNPLLLDCPGEVRQVMMFWDMNKDAAIGPFDFALDATSDHVVRRLECGPGTYKFYRSRNELDDVLIDGFPLWEIPVGADLMTFSFEPAAAPPRPHPPPHPELLINVPTEAAPASASTVTVTFILPPNDATQVVSIGCDCTVSQAIELSRNYFPADPNKVYGIRLSDDVCDDFLDPDSRVIDVEEPRDFFISEAISIVDDIGKRTVHVNATGSQTVGEVAKSLRGGSVIVDRRGVAVEGSLRMSWDSMKGSFPLHLIETGLEREVTVTYLDGTKHQHRIYCFSQVVSLREFVGELMGSSPTSFVFSNVSDDLPMSDAPAELVCSAPTAKRRKGDRPVPAVAHMSAPRPDIEPVLPDRRRHRFYRGLDDGRSRRILNGPARPVSDWVRHFEVDKLPTFGEGSDTVLTLFDDGSTKKKIFVKTFDERLRDDPSQRTRFINEVEMLWNLKHPCVVSLAGFGLSGRRSACQIGTEFAVMGSLKSSIGCGNVVSGTEIAIIISGIVIGMRFIHSRGVIHRCLNLDNIVLDEFGHVRITGFDWSLLTDVDPIGADPPMSKFTAPEMYEGGKSTNAVDVFAFGIILYELIVGEAVFARTESRDEVMAKVIGGEMPKIPESVNETVRKVIMRSWLRAPELRPSFDEILFAFDRIKFRLVAKVDVDRVYEFISAVMVDPSA
jgi:serine/threonine protein kinase